MKCSKCGNINTNDSQFCTSCGNRLEQTQNVVVENGNVRIDNRQTIRKVGVAGSVVILILSILTMSLVGIILSIISIVKLSSANSMAEGNERQAKIRSGKACRTVALVFLIIEILSIVAAIVIILIFGAGVFSYISLDTSSIDVKKISDDIVNKYQVVDDQINKKTDDKKSSKSDENKDDKTKSTSTTTDTSKSTTSTTKDTTTSKTDTTSDKSSSKIDTTTSSNITEVICRVKTDFDEKIEAIYLGQFKNNKLTSLTGTVQIKLAEHDETYINSAKTIFGCGDAAVSCQEVNNILTISETVSSTSFKSGDVLSANTTPEEFKKLYTDAYKGKCN